MSDTVIKVSGLGKRYKLGMTLGHDTLRDQITHAAKHIFLAMKKDNCKPAPSVADKKKARHRNKNFWALKDINFEVKRGEILGIIGHNGAGKSTLLKILSKITEPTKGEIRIRGRVGSLLEVGTGMHPELSGRENVYLNGAILGMSKKEIDDKYDQIVDFSGIRDFMSTPVKRYSSGMRVRLGFSIAAHLEPEILFIDEVLAVGDINFQKKCLGRMESVAGSGRTVLFVSHNMSAVNNLCNRSILLNDGKIIVDGNTADIVSEYLAIGANDSNSSELENHIDRTGNQNVIFSGFHIEDSKGSVVGTISSGDSLTFVFCLKVNEGNVKNVDVGFRLHDAMGACLICLYSSYQGQYWNFAEQGYEYIRCKIPSLALTPGRISVKGRVLVNNIEADWPRLPIGFFDVADGDFFGTGRSSQTGTASFLVKGEWK